MNSLLIGPPSTLRGRIVLPASKSISNRALIINALSGGTVLPAGLSDSDDTQVMLRALAACAPGATPGGPTPNPSLIGRGTDTTGRLSTPLPAREGPLGEGSLGVGLLDIGAAGTAMRFLTAYLSVTEGEHVITGTERMRHRPIGILVDALRELGADIAYEGEEGFPPLRIKGRTGLEGGTLTVAGNVSSQYVSALLMIAPTLKKGLRLTLTGSIASRPYLDMTLSMMRDFGAKAGWEASPLRGGVEESVIEVKPVAYQPRPYRIESDWSAASYWYEMVALSRDAGAEVHLAGLHRDSIQGDSRVREMFSELGVETTFFREADGTEAVRLTRSGKPCKHLELDLIGQPDLAQTLIVCCAMLGTTFRFSGLASLKIKETDRTAALRAELRKLGIVIREDGDSTVYWDGERCLAEASPAISTYEDHRMAMSFAPVCLRTERPIQINDPQVVSKSYPGFWDDLSKVGVGLTPSGPSPSGPTPNPSLVGRETDTTERLSTPLPTREEPGEGLPGESLWCCGQHEVCEKDLLRAAAEEIEYYEDEELDRFRGRQSYSEEEVEEFREVLYTMRPDEVAGWLHSLELRRVDLPGELKDEVLLIIEEQRQ